MQCAQSEEKNFLRRFLVSPEHKQTALIVMMAILIVFAITFSPSIIAYFASDLLYAVMAKLQLPRETP